MAVVAALVVVAAAVVVMWVVVAREPGPSAAETAMAYELAWSRSDFASVYVLSGDELRDGSSRAEFASARSADGLENSAGEEPVVTVESVDAHRDVAHVITAVALGTETAANDVVLARRGGRWVVVNYNERTEPEPAD